MFAVFLGAVTYSTPSQSKYKTSHEPIPSFVSKKEFFSTAYFKDVPSKTFSDDDIYTLAKILKNDNAYKKAYQYILNKKLKTKKVTTDEFGGKIETYVTNYKQVLKFFKISVNQHKNVLSAYATISIISSFIGTKDKKYEDQYRKALSFLYKNGKNCSRYIYMGRAYQQGRFGFKKDTNRALKIYKKGLNSKCSEFDLTKNILQGKIKSIELLGKK